MLDFREAVWHHNENPLVAKCRYIKTDISSIHAVKAAFDAPWPSSEASTPLTVFHTAAVIRPHERSKLLYHRCSKVNLDGTANIIASSKAAGADILVTTSSGSIALKPVRFWISPWTKYPGRLFQLYDESDAYGPERPHEDFFANYAVSKARAERLVMKANDEKLKTGCIRPASGVYGNEHDHNIATYIPMEEIPT
jgi:nucleoside-diphosphate-sugar epimerase